MISSIAATETQTQSLLGQENDEFEDVVGQTVVPPRINNILQMLLKQIKVGNTTLGSIPHGVLAGGVFSSLYLNKVVKDYDVYIPKDKFSEVVQSLGFAKPNNKRNIQIGKVQLIPLLQFDSPEEILSTFDFSVCRIAYDLTSGLYHTSDSALDDLVNRRLNLIVRNGPVDVQMHRIYKYVSKGFKPTKETFEYLYNTWDEDLLAPWYKAYAGTENHDDIPDLDFRDLRGAPVRNLAQEVWRDDMAVGGAVRDNVRMVQRIQQALQFGDFNNDPDMRGFQP